MKNNITALGDNQIFVFGSNLHGHHAGGAAKTAHERFGAVWGQAEGLQGQSYAIPTLDTNMQQIPLQDVQKSLHTLIDVANKTPDTVYFLTPIGTGIAGRTMEELEAILPTLPDNINPTWI